MFYAGQQIGVYVLIERLGKGGFGEVWLAERRSGVLTRKVAIKLPHQESVNLEAIRQEAALWEQVSKHENVLTIFDADIFDGQVAIISEYAEGGSLADKLRTDGNLPITQAVEITIGILRGLAHLHSKNIVHRDIKPQNILLQDNMPRLADFGISRAMNASSVTSIVVGTDSYMAPEALDGVRSVQTDIWSVGVVLYQLLTGKLPFPQEHHSERMLAILMKDYEPLPGNFPPDVKEILQKALAKKPAERFSTANEMGKRLEAFLIYQQNLSLAPTEAFSFPTEHVMDTLVVEDPPVIEDTQPFIKDTLPIEVSYETPLTLAAKTINSRSQKSETFKQKTSENIEVGKETVVAAQFTESLFSDSESTGKNKILLISAAIVLCVIGFFIIKAFFGNDGTTSTANVANRNLSAVSSQNLNTNGNFQTTKTNSNTTANLSAKLTPREYFILAQTCGEKKDFICALENYTKAIELKPDFEDAYNNRGNIYYKRGEYDQAVNDYKKALELNPNDKKTQTNLELAQQKQNKQK